MALLGGLLSVKGVAYLSFSVFLVAAIGYALGKITIKGVNLGTAGVFIIALLFGCFFYDSLDAQLVIKGTETTYTGDALKVVENLGLIFFVTSVGFIAGPNFFGNLKKNFKSYVLLGLVIIAAASLTCVACIFVGKSLSPSVSVNEMKAMLVGLMSGALTSTPAFASAKATIASLATNVDEAVTLESVVTVGYGIAYLFGVVGVVLFVQIIPKILKADMTEEVKKISINKNETKARKHVKLVDMDEFGLMVFSLAVILGIMFGAISYNNFSLTTTGGCLLVALVFGHFGNIGRLNIMPKTSTLKILRELGLMFFLIGAGIPGGAKFVEYFELSYFIYGVIMTTIPMVIGYFVAKHLLKLPLLNTLGSITGGMTSTPALGTLINTSGTEDVATAYAATYPIALVAIVVASQLILLMC